MEKFQFLDEKNEKKIDEKFSIRHLLFSIEEVYYHPGTIKHHETLIMALKCLFCIFLLIKLLIFLLNELTFSNGVFVSFQVVFFVF